MKDLNEITTKSFSEVFFRKKKLRDAVVEIMELVSGTDQKIRPYMEDSTGHYSEERTLATVEELLNALQIYLRFERAEETDEITGTDENGDDIYAYQYYEMPEEEIACYRAFLYCALRELYANYSPWGWYDSEDGLYRQVFGELIDLAKNQKVFRSYKELLRYEYTEKFAEIPQLLFPQSTGAESGAAEIFTETRHWLGGYKGITWPDEADHQKAFQAYYMATDEEMEQLLQSMTEEEQVNVAHRLQEYDDIQQAELEFFKSGNTELFGEEADLYETMGEEEIEMDELERKGYEVYAENFSRAFVHFDTYQLYLDRYLHLQHHLRSTADFADAISGMVDFFLLSKGRSCFGDPEKFYRILTQLRRLSRQTAAGLRESEA